MAAEVAVEVAALAPAAPLLPADTGPDSWLGFAGVRFNMPLRAAACTEECCWPPAGGGCCPMTVVPVKLPSSRPRGTTTSVCNGDKGNVELGIVHHNRDIRIKTRQ